LFASDGETFAAIIRATTSVLPTFSQVRSPYE
jgi:hypothetical protein